jgi:hypothetical protein
MEFNAGCRIHMQELARGMEVTAGCYINMQELG